MRPNEVNDSAKRDWDALLVRQSASPFMCLVPVDTMIGDDVVLGAGSKVLPGWNIGAGAKIGANCVVVEHVPPRATVVLPKPRILLNGVDD